MKKSKWLLLLVSVLLVCSLIATMVACGPKEPVDDDDKPQGPDASELRTEVADAIWKSFEFDATKPLGFEYALAVPTADNTYTIEVKGNLDTTTVNNTKALIALKDKNKTIFTITADDEYMYLVAGETKRRFTGLELGAMIEGTTLPGSSDIQGLFGGMMGAIPSMVFDMLFGGDATAATEGDLRVITLNGSLEEIGGMVGGLLGGMLPPELSGVMGEVTNFLSGITTKLVAKLDKNGEMASCDITLNTDMGPANLEFDSKFGNEAVTIETPAKDDATFVETALLNFTINGEFNIYTEDGAVVPYTYDIRADLDIFGMIKGAVKANNASGLFAEDDSKIYINVSHDCGESACAFCENKEGAARGSILTVGYDFATYGDRFLHVNTNIKNVLPKGTVPEIDLGLLGKLNIIEMFGEYVALDINPAALLASIGADTKVPPVEVPKNKLATPVITIDKDGNATWGKVDNAAKYSVTIDDKTSEVAADADLKATLTDGQTIKVKAIAGEIYIDSDEAVATYVANPPVAPTVDVAKAVLKAVSFLSATEFENYELKFDMYTMNKFVEVFDEVAGDIIGKTLSQFVGSFFGNAESFGIKANATMYDVENTKMDVKKMSLEVKPGGEIKNFVNKDNNDYNPAMGITPVVGKDGGIVIKYNDGAKSNYDADGNRIVEFTKEELQAMLKGNSSFKYTDSKGVEGEISTSIYKVIGLDWSKVNEEQTITIVYDYVGHSGMVALIMLANGFVQDLNLHIPGYAAQMTIKIVEPAQNPAA